MPAAGCSTDEPRITVVIATRDRTDSLLRCLASVSRLNYRAFDVVVVDSAPASDLTARTLAGRQDWPFSLRYLRAARPGLALAHNEALRAVTGEIVAFTDDDVEVDGEWLSAYRGGLHRDRRRLRDRPDPSRRTGDPGATAGGAVRRVRPGLHPAHVHPRHARSRAAVPVHGGPVRIRGEHGLPHRLAAQPRRFRSGHRRGDPGQGRRRPDRVPAHHRRRRDAGVRARRGGAALAPPGLRGDAPPGVRLRDGPGCLPDRGGLAQARAAGRDAPPGRARGRAPCSARIRRRTPAAASRSPASWCGGNWPE